MQEAEEAEQRETPVAEREREESQLAYADLSPSEAAHLLRSEFGEQLALIDKDPARALTEAELERPIGATGALVEVEGDPALVEGTMPVRVADESGELRKINLELEQTSGGSFVTENGLVDLELPQDASEPMQIGELGLAIEPVLAAGESSAQRFGEKDLLYPEALEATDLLATPISTGLELSALLRSRQSPEEFRFALTLPPGAELRSDGEGGAQILRDGQVLAGVRTPSAIDAQGADVPVSMQVEGAELVLSIEHRQMDVAYPLLLDPIVDEWFGSLSWYAGYNLQGLSDGSWASTSNDYGRFKFETQPWYSSSFEGSNKGLFISYQGGSETQWAYRHGAWVYTVPGSTTYITDAGVSPFWRHNNGCPVSTHPKPHDYIGLWSDEWSQYGWISMQINAAEQAKQAWTKPPSGWREITAKQLHLGLAVGIYNTAPLSCNRDLYAGGVYVWMDDLERPTLSAFSAPSTEWVSDDKPFSMSASASDAGLGVKTFNIWPQGQDNFDRPSTPNQCTGFRANPCPASVSNLPISLDADRFGEGIRTATISAKDPLGKVSDSYTFTTKVDRLPPQITLSGQLAKETREENGDGQDPAKWEDLSLPVYNLTVEAKDGNSAPTALPAEERSGVKDIEIWLDGVEREVEWSPQAATEDSRPMTVTYSLKLSELTTAGKHKLKVLAIDHVGKKLTREIEFEYIPATGMKDEYVMHYFPLPDGSGSEDEEEHPARPELAVNVMNGNLVYREQDVEVDGTATVDLDVERYYNSMQPASEDSEWGEGWSLAETPDLELIDTGGSAAPEEANLLGSSGLLKGSLLLPAEPGSKVFDPVLQASLLKRPSGGYELIDETGESATSVAFDETGQAEALLTEGFAKVDYTYEGGELAGIEVVDPATFAADPEELEIPKPQLVTAPVYSSAFGSNGSGDGQFKSPADVAVDGAGNIFVADRANNRIQKFDPSGKFVSKFGAGLLEGQLSKPSAVALDPAGNLWVADTANHRIKKFSSSGAFLAGYGSQGTFVGQFATGGPEGIATDAAGNVWVSDTQGGRIQKFSSSGLFLKAAGSKGSGLGQLGEPAGLDVAPDGKVWVADRLNNRIAVFSEAGEFLFHFGVKGTGNGAFEGPGEVEIDASGAVWVADRGNHRVQQFNQGAEYVAQFGSSGSGEGKFSFAPPIGIGSDSKGRLWVADPNNHRVQLWLVPIPKPTYASSFGTNGAGDGQLKSPADAVLDHQGNLWIADRANHRIQKFAPSGQFLAKYGSLGTGDGQFNQPSSITVDRDGNILVADTGNHRIQKLSTTGEFLAKFGSQGASDGQLSYPEEIVADKSGNIWVADTQNGRVQQFDEGGGFLKVLDSGQLFEPAGLDVTAGGFVLVADRQKNRVSVFSGAGAFVNNIGSEGSGNGQFDQPDAIEVDNKGNVWVSERGNDRIQRFNLFGAYVGQFGAYGSGAGQFNFNAATGMTSDREGRLWIADPANHRIQKWLIANYAPAQGPELDLSDGDAAVEVETSGDLVTAITGNAAGEHSYEHESGFLVSHDGPEGETTYEKDSAERLSEVTLPNGTWAKVEYFGDNRVKKVTVSVEGAAAKATEFEYKDEPRSTLVIPPDDPAVTYDIGEDGSVLKWWHVAKPPEFLDISGTLWSEREKEVEAGDQTLKVVADSPHGISSIRFIANGDQLVDEKTCAQIEGGEVECIKEENLWVTDTADFAPGILNLEAIVTDRFGKSETERFWVEIPQTSPPTPGAPVPPRYKDILKFREDYGLEVVFPVANETELSERIFDLIGAWHNPHTPLGEVARSSWERWGVPLRPADVAELEYRQRYVEQAGVTIPNWASANAPSTYAGYYVNHRAGGVIHVGFTENQATLLSSLKNSEVLPAARLAGFPSEPKFSYATLLSAQQAVADHGESLPSFTQAPLDLEHNLLRVGTTGSVSAMDSTLHSLLGAGAPYAVFFDSEPPGANTSFGRDRLSGRIRAGDRITTEEGECTANFGAWEKHFNLHGKRIDKHFLLTAGHCADHGVTFFREKLNNQTNTWEYQSLGQVRRQGIEGDAKVDALAILLQHQADGWAPRQIYLSPSGTQPVEGITLPTPGMIVSTSGQRTDKVLTGEVLGPPVPFQYTNYAGLIAYEVPINVREQRGDSGGPVWQANTGNAVGLWNAGTLPSFVTPLLPYPVEVENNYGNVDLSPGALAKLGLSPGNLSFAR